MSQEEYGKRARKAASGRKAFSKVPIASMSDVFDRVGDTGQGEINGVSGPDIFDAGFVDSVTGFTNHGETSRELRKSNGKTSELSDKTKKRVKALDAVMEESKLTDDIFVYSEVADAKKVFGDAWSKDGNNTGLTWVDHGYVDTDVRATVSPYDHSANNIQVSYLVPKGTKAIGTDFTVKKAMSKSGNREILLDRNLKYRIVSDTGPRQSMNAIRLVSVEVVQ